MGKLKKIKVHIADDHQILIDGIYAVLSSEENIDTLKGARQKDNQVPTFTYIAKDKKHYPFFQPANWPQSKVSKGRTNPGS